MANAFKVAVIGLGNMGRHHVRHYAGMDNVELTWVCDMSEERAQKYATEYNCKAYTNVKDALTDAVDAVSIVASTTSHAFLGELALKAGCHVLMEKPLAVTLQEADHLISLANEQRLTLRVGHIERFNPAIVTLKKLIDEGKLGDLISLDCQRMSMFPSQMKDANVVLDLAVHDLDICAYLTGQRPDKIVAKNQRSIISDRADSSDIFVSYPSAAASIQVNWTCPTKVRGLRVLGSKGLVEINYLTPSLHFTPSHYELEKNDDGSEVARFSETETTTVEIPQHDALCMELSEFIKACQGQPNQAVPAQAGRDALEDALEALA